MDNHLVVGVGNIYACESLFLSGINPMRPANSLSLEECGTLVRKIVQVLTAAIQAGGSSIRDYKHTNGNSGHFQNSFNVYQREQEPCHHCTTPIAQVKLAGRSSFFCPTCQGA
jgi:formamidopyrimidine-DNA glycosylase